jgi:two-component system chemotaxis sensor kinase CheA
MEDGEIILFNRDRHIPVIFTEQLITGVTVSRKPGEYVILIISYEGGLYGIAVDQVIGKQEIVIKSLNEVLRDMNLFSGGTIFGDGTIGFVVDIDEFMRKAQA